MSLCKVTPLPHYNNQLWDRVLLMLANDQIDKLIHRLLRQLQCARVEACYRVVFEEQPEILRCEAHRCVLCEYQLWSLISLRDWIVGM